VGDLTGISHYQSFSRGKKYSAVYKMLPFIVLSFGQTDRQTDTSHIVVTYHISGPGVRMKRLALLY